MKNILRNRTLAIALALFLLMGMLTPLASAADFGDTSGHWGEAAIGKWADYGIIEGDGVNFRPDDPVTRGEFAVIVNRIAKYQKAAANTFSDLEAGLWYTDAMLKLNAAGVLNGDGGGRISPNGTLPREQAIAILARMFDVEPDASGLTGFSDAATVDVWARAEVGGMAKAGYVQGSGGKLDPKGILTRSSAVQLFDNIIKGFYNTAGTYTIETDGIVVVNTTGVVLTNSKIGALFVTQGIGANGDFTLKNSNVQSFTVEGGGEHSIIIDNSTVGSLTVSVDSSTGNVRIHLTGGSEVEDAYVFVEGSEIVYFTNDTGTVVGSITVSEDGTIVVTGEVGEVNVIGDDVKVVVESSGKVGSINVEGDGATMDVRGTVEEVIVNGDDASVEGSGKVESVKVESGEGTEVTTGGTKVEVSDNAGDVKTKDGEIKSGESDTTPENTGGGGGGGGPVGPSYSITDVPTTATGGTSAHSITFGTHGSYEDSGSSLWGGLPSTTKFDISYSLSNISSQKNVALAFMMVGTGTAALLALDPADTSGQGLWNDTIWNVLGNKTYPETETTTPGAVEFGAALAAYDGYWGRVGGRPVTGSYTKSADTYKFFADTAGEYTLTIDLISFDGTNIEILATKTITIEVGTTTTLDAGGYYKITSTSGTEYLKADGTRTTDIGQIDAIVGADKTVVKYSGETLKKADPYSTDVYIAYTKNTAYDGGKTPYTPVDGKITINPPEDAYYEMSVETLFTDVPKRLDSTKTASNFQFAILGRISSTGNGNGATVQKGPFYVWSPRVEGDNPTIWEGYISTSPDNTVIYPDNASWVGIFINNQNAGGITHQINLGNLTTNTNNITRTFIFDCDNGEFVFLNVNITPSV